MYERGEHAYFLRVSGTDTLWIRSELGVVGKAVSRPTASDETTAQLDLLGILFRARAGVEWPRKLISSGAFQSDYVQLLADIERDLEVNTQSALRNLSKPKPASDKQTKFMKREKKMGKVTIRALKADDPIFREGISRSHPLLERKKLLAMEKEASKETKPPTEKRTKKSII
jgi:hypothetical protein